MRRYRAREAGTPVQRTLCALNAAEVMDFYLAGRGVQSVLSGDDADNDDNNNNG